MKKKLLKVPLFACTLIIENNIFNLNYARIKFKFVLLCPYPFFSILYKRQLNKITDEKECNK